MLRSILEAMCFKVAVVGCRHWLRGVKSLFSLCKMRKMLKQQEEDKDESGRGPWPTALLSLASANRQI